MEPLLDKEAVTELLGITPRHLDYLINKRRIPFVKVGGRTIKFKPADIQALIDESYVEAVE